MTKVRLALLATAATGVLTVAGLAYAANNEAYIEQSGSDNTASIDQTNSGVETTGNKFGSSTLTVRQEGDLNSINSIQSGDSNSIGLQGDGVDQLGANNEIEIWQTSDSNTIGSVQQIESTATGADGSNYLRVKQQVGDNNVVGTVTQETTADGNNRAILRQDGSNNRIKSVNQYNNGDGENNAVVRITGDSNGTNDTLTGYALESGASGSTISQSGSDNTIKLYMEGNRNQFGSNQSNTLGGANKINPNEATDAIEIQGDDNQIGITQKAQQAGDINSLTLKHITGNSNNVGVSQQGWGLTTGTIELGDSSNNNAVFLQQKHGADANIKIVEGDSNRIRVKQDYASTINNDASVTITSSDMVSLNNEAYINQQGNGHFAKTTIVGDQNYSLVYQENGYSNSGTDSITGDDNSVIIMQRNGSHNNIADISVNGASNDVRSWQTYSNSSDVWVNIAGDYNQVKTTQQTSDTDAIDFDIVGNSNDFDATQYDSAGSSMNIDIFGDFNGKGAWTSGGTAASVGLTAGYLSQTGVGNELNISIGSASDPSSSNLVAALQDGDSNLIDVDISEGASNEVAIQQNGNGNVSVVTQIGSSNIVGISQ
nr:hypothetical protein [uncultured Cohaesibacter sp.]